MEITVNLNPTDKQKEAYRALLDPNVDTVFFGGSAGGGKSWIICESRLLRAYTYPGYRSFIAREELKRLMQSTYVTWTKVCQYYKIPQDDWKLNGQYNYIEFKNGSRIDLLDIKLVPSDPLFERFGSLEYTDGAIEEAGETAYLAYDVLKSRIGRHKNKEFGLHPTMLISGNPKKNWTFTEFYKPWKNGTLPANARFIQALYTDNKHTAEEYGKQLSQIHDRVMKERLMYGNWDYADDDNALMSFDNIQDMFTNTIEETDTKYLTVDVARYGSDSTVFNYWKGLHSYKTERFTKLGVDQVSEKLKIALRDEKIPYSHCGVDDDGIGGGVTDMVKGVRPFTANKTPFMNRYTGKPDNFRNLKTQCAYLLAELVNAHKVKVTCDDATKELLSEELAQIKRKDSDKEGKLEIEPKDKQKEMLGRSPDVADTLVMRMMFELERPTKDPIKHDPITFMLAQKAPKQAGVEELDFR